MQKRFRTQVLPELVLIDAGGTVRWRLRGEMDWRDDRTRAWLSLNGD